MPPILQKKYYVVVGTFPGQDWYLHDAGSEFNTTIRVWVQNPNKAIKFKSVDEAKQIGTLVCEDFFVEGFTKLS